MFTIEVKKRGKDEKFDFNDLKLATTTYDACIGGKMRLKRRAIKKSKWDDGDFKVDGLFLECRRCRAVREIELTYEIELAIIKTAIDGQERKITDDIRVIQKT